MKKLITFGLLATSIVFADTKKPLIQETEPVPVTSQKAYLSLGAAVPLPLILPIPLFGVGGRFQHDHHGTDLSLQGVSFGSGFSVLKQNFDYLHYFHPKLASQFYLGCGASFTEVFLDRHCEVLFSPQFLVGKQFTNDDGDVRFWQVQIEPVFVNLNHPHKKRSWGAFPGLAFSYGICF